MYVSPLGVSDCGHQRSRGLPLLIRDFVQWDAASVTGANAADVCDGQEVCNACHAHASTVEIHVSQVHLF